MCVLLRSEQKDEQENEHDPGILSRLADEGFPRRLSLLSSFGILNRRERGD